MFPAVPTCLFRPFLGIAALSLATTLHALPILQLGIGGGTYDADSQTVMADSDPFTLYALVNSASSKYAGPTNYYLSAAVIPQGTLPTDPFGSFTVSWTTAVGAQSTTFSAANMFYGTPPADTLDLDPTEYANRTDWTVPDASKDLASHGIFATVFGEIRFDFRTSNRAAAYNVQTSPDGFVASPTGTLLYQAFEVDTRNLGAGYSVHFDLYRANGNQVTQFAPFSHDAQSMEATFTGTGVPVPDHAATLLLAGVGLAGLFVARRSLRRA